MRCPSSHELSAALTANDGALDAHLAACTTCAAEWRATAELIALARETAPLPSAARREEVRTMLLASSRTADVLAEAPRRRWPYAAGALAVAAAATVVLLARDAAPPAAHTHGTVAALAGASFIATQGAPDENVLLFDGAIDVSVAPLHPGERFRVLVGRDVVEVHGTQFVVTAKAGALVDVRVIRGVVEVRPQFGAAQVLHDGEVWRAPVAELPRVVQAPIVVEEVAPPVRTRRSVRAQPPVAVEPAPAPVAAEPEKPAAKPEQRPEERAYDDGWKAMRESRFPDAAKAFLRVQLLDPDGALAEDATYWYAVALARAKSEQAIDAFRSLLAHYPRSRRAGEASAMLGWLLVDAKRHAEARRRFEAALTDPSAQVRSSAQSGLDALR